ncbi:MAG: helix-turn-helix domain-containing protein [Candidatus Omnitrophica bacterium]|nr:helix-turn-helix domain-containing protein [Candidatus Omnitrophota bacterium]
MGVKYKLQPEIGDFVLERKKAEPSISCRQLATLVLDKFKIEISKSSVNSIIKNAGLSMPVGRRQKKKRRRLGPVNLALEIKPGSPLAIVPEEPTEIPAQEPVLPPIEKEVLKEPIILPEEPPEESPVPPVEEPTKEITETPVVEPPVEKLPEEIIVPPVEEPKKEKPVEESIELLLAGGLPQKTVEPNPETKEPPETPPEEPSSPPVVEKLEPPVVEKPPEEPIIAPVEKSVEKPMEVPPVEIYAELPSEQPCTGAILLKAADCLIGGSNFIAELIKARLIRRGDEALPLTESLIYLPLFEQEIEKKEIQELWALIERKIPVDSILRYLNDLQVVNTLLPEISDVIFRACQDVRCVKVVLSDETTFYLDGQMYTVWSSPHIPYDFSTSTLQIKSYINKYFGKNAPFILSMAPGYDAPNREFFDFMSSLESIENHVEQLVLYGNKFEEIETILTPKNQKHFFIFGLWPWQFTGYRKVKTVGEFRRFTFEALKEDYYLADIEIELLQPTTQQLVTLRGCTFKKALNEKVRLIILSNFSVEQASAEELANTYLNHWPNLEETFQDFSRKIELFTYTAASQRFFSTENLVLSEDASQDIKKFFDYYLKVLDLYVKCHFLPSGYEEKDFATIKESFYNLKGQLKKEDGRVKVTFKPPQGYPYLKDLEYLCRRINEREVIFSDGKRLWVSV